MTHSPSSAPAAERRAFRRIACELHVQLHLGVTVFRVDLTSISQSGMFVRPALRSASSSLVAAAVLKPGKPLRLRLEIAGSTGLHEARARVTRQSDLGIGVEFIELTPALAAWIEQLVASDGRAELFWSITCATLTLAE